MKVTKQDYQTLWNIAAQRRDNFEDGKENEKVTKEICFYLSRTMCIEYSPRIWDSMPDNAILRKEMNHVYESAKRELKRILAPKEEGLKAWSRLVTDMSSAYVR